MSRRAAVYGVILFSLPAVSLAQTKVSGVSQCGKPDAQHVLPVGDHPGHDFVIVKLKCSWLTPLQVGGIAAKEDEITVFQEVTGTKANEHNFVVGKTTNGDTVFVRTQGTAAVKNGVSQSSEGTWTYVGGTGKFKGLTGKGTYKNDGTSTRVDGEYRLPKQ